MRTIITVFHKEMIDTIRDRRTIMFMVVIPLLVFPLLFKVMFSIQKSQKEKAATEELRIACITNGNAAGFVEMIRNQDDIIFVEDVPKDSVRAYVRSERLDGAFIFKSNFDAEVAALRPGTVDFYYKKTSDTNIKRQRIEDLIDNYEDVLLDARFEQLEFEREISMAVKSRSHNVASVEEQFGHQVGGFLPYIFIIFCFVGAMYPAIDLGAGEKERGTLETLLTAPVSRFHILLGKFGVVVVSGLLSAIVSMIGLYVGVRQAGELPPEFFEIVVKILGIGNILLVLSLLVPLTFFFAGILLSISLSAKSFKEAQSLITPLNMAIILPAAIGMMPGIEMNFAMAAIPVLNVSLATKEIIAGTMSIPHLIVVYSSLITLAALSLALAAHWFNREATIFRT